MPSKKKKYNARFPPARIKKIMQMDEEVGKVAATVPVIISRALELFIESLIQQATQTTLSKNAKTLSTSHIKQTIESQERYKFLRELVANVPDHQMEEEGVSNNQNNGDESNSCTISGKRPRGRPRKTKDGTGIVPRKERRKRKKESSESSGSENSEDTDDADEDTDEESTSISSAMTTTTTASTSNGDATTSACTEPSLDPVSTTPLSQPSPVLESSSRSQYTQDVAATMASLSAAPTFHAPAMIPAAMPVYQSMPGATTPHLFGWPGSCSALPGMMTAGFPPLAAHGAAFPGMHQHNTGFTGITMPNIGFTGIPATLTGYPGLPMSGPGISGVSALGPGFQGVGVTGSGFPTKLPAVAGVPSAAQPDDDYDT